MVCVGTLRPPAECEVLVGAKADLLPIHPRELEHTLPVAGFHIQRHYPLCLRLPPRSRKMPPEGCTGAYLVLVGGIPIVAQGSGLAHRARELQVDVAVEEFPFPVLHLHL